MIWAHDFYGAKFRPYKNTLLQHDTLLKAKLLEFQAHTKFTYEI